MSQQWNADLYDGKLAFVSQYGEEVVELLQPLYGERILDLGCGSGDLANLIAQSGATVTGVDLSSEMIEKARNKYPHVSFATADGEALVTNEVFDAVFSNAALHWMKNADRVVHNIHNALRPGGRFIAEFGGKGNVGSIIRSIYEVLAEDYTIDARTYNPWFFPSISEYSSILEQNGFHVTYAIHFDRPTLMEDGERGIQYWLDGFANSFFKDLTNEQRNTALSRIIEKLEPELFQDGHWFVDYKRIRVIAIKQ